MKKIIYFSGTRADFGLMESSLKLLDGDPYFSVSVVATGMHLSSKHGHTIEAIHQSGLPIIATVPVKLLPETGVTMSKSFGEMLLKFTDIIDAHRPDIVMLLGDRGEMLAAAIAALHLGIVIVHIGGGERSGTIDESIRHAISKIAHIHFTTTIEGKSRLIGLGESPGSVFVSGAPGLDGIKDLASLPKSYFAERYGLNMDGLLGLLIFHPVVQVSHESGEQMRIVLNAVSSFGEVQWVLIMPNSDAGSGDVRLVIESESCESIHPFSNLSRSEYLSILKNADIMVGNSSSGIIEAASFGTPVVNVGDRQNLRERNANILDVPVDFEAIQVGVDTMLSHGRYIQENIYGDGACGERLVNYLKGINFEGSLLNKAMTY